MRKIIFFLAIVCLNVIPVKANLQAVSSSINIQDPSDSLRIVETQRLWDEVSKTVQEGDLEGYAAAYHPDAVVVFGSKTSTSIAEALEGWKQLFVDTNSGKIKADVQFRFSNRIGNETTAHETGIFRYSTIDEAGKKQDFYSHFEGLLVKKDCEWLIVMENQKSTATPEEWEKLKY